MSVWSKPVSPAGVLGGSQGSLVSISISVSPQLLESLLEALAQLRFPINPQIYHDAAIVYHFSDHQESEAATLVEFPAYSEQVGDVRQALQSSGFEPSSIRITDMLDEIHADRLLEAAPAGAPYLCRSRLKSRTALAH
jgi:hypothetical protein